MKELFDKLKSHANCNVDKIITFGPGEFKSTKDPRTRDCGRYIEGLFGMLGEEFGKLTGSAMLASFNRLFLVTSRNVI